MLLILAAAKSHQSRPTLCDPIDGSPPGSPVPGILQARTLEWVAISFSNAWKWKVKVKSLSHVQFFTTPWTAAYHTPPPMGFSRQEYWSGVPSPSLQWYIDGGKILAKWSSCETSFRYCIQSIWLLTAVLSFIFRHSFGKISYPHLCHICWVPNLHNMAGDPKEWDIVVGAMNDMQKEVWK